MKEVIDIKKYVGRDEGERIDLTKLRESSKRTLQGLIGESEEEIEEELAGEHTSEPIKSIEDIDRISEYLISRKRYRDNMLFIVGINFGLRVSDLRRLRFCNLINEEFMFKESFAILEKKTKNTRKKKKNRHITINTAVMEAVTLYLENTEGVKLSDYLFRSQSQNKPLTRGSIDTTLKGIAKDLDLPYKIATHSLRKTFAYHQMVMSHNDPRKLLLLQKMFGHSTSAQTLDYIGITNEEIEDAYRQLNLGSKDHHYLIDSDIIETA